MLAICASAGEALGVETAAEKALAALGLSGFAMVVEPDLQGLVLDP
jgi:hypothetical protein